MKLWIDDVKPAPDGYFWCKSVNHAVLTIQEAEHVAELHSRRLSLDNQERNLKIIQKVQHYLIEIIDIDHDAGDYAKKGGDYIRLLDWIEKTGRNYPIRIHSMNPVGVANMRAIIQRNGWKEVF